MLNTAEIFVAQTWFQKLMSIFVMKSHIKVIHPTLFTVNKEL